MPLGAALRLHGGDTQLPSPPGMLGSFSDTDARPDSKKLAQAREMKKRRAGEIAKSPGKNLFMTAFMMWMSGSNVNIFSIMITGMALMTPLKSLTSINQAFAKVDDGSIDLTQAKLTFVAMNFLGLGMAMYKLAMMGLLPLTSADWTGMLVTKEVLEVSAGTL